MLEPFGRNTAPAIAVAARLAKENHQTPLLLVLAADHVIPDVDAFQTAVANAAALAADGSLVTFGVVPDAPETGYGYIRRGEPITEDGYRVDGFVEKPDLNTAQTYLESGEYFWNSGMFMLEAGQFLQELGKFQPKVDKVCFDAISALDVDADFTRIPAEIFEACPDISVDYAVMEHTKDAAMVPLDAVGMM